MINSTYTAAPIQGNPNIDLDKRVQMSWLAIGLYVFLRKNPPVGVAEISKQAYNISYGAIALALNELIDQGLVIEQISEERIEPNEA